MIEESREKAPEIKPSVKKSPEKTLVKYRRVAHINIQIKEKNSMFGSFFPEVFSGLSFRGFFPGGFFPFTMIERQGLYIRIYCKTLYTALCARREYVTCLWDGSCRAKFSAFIKFWLCPLAESCCISRP